jgi:hypothetical protein
MASTVPPDRCGSADTAKSEDPLDGKPSEDARLTLTHVDSCSSLPEAGDDLVPCSRRNSSQPNQQYGRNEEFGSETLMHLLANASTLLTAQDLELPPNDPRALLPTPFAPGQSARTLSEQELKRKREQENKEWHAWRSKTSLPSERADPKRDLPLGRGRARPLPTLRGRARSNESSAGDPLFQQQQRQPQQPLLQQQQQQHLLNLQRQLSGGLLNRQQISPMQLMYPPNAPQLSFQQPARMGIDAGVGVGLRQLDAFGGNANSNNMMLPNNFASAFALAANNGIDRAGLNNWLLHQQQAEASTTENRNGINNANTPMMQESTKTATRRVDMGSFGENNVSDKSRSHRWTQRYNELLEFKRVEGVSCIDF